MRVKSIPPLVLLLFPLSPLLPRCGVVVFGLEMFSPPMASAMFEVVRPLVAEAGFVGQMLLSKKSVQ